MSLRVNGQPITPQAIEFELARLVRFHSRHMREAEVGAQMNVLRQKAKEQAIGAKLLLDEARRLDIAVAPEDVAARLAEMIKSAGGPDRFQAILRKQNLSEPTVRRSIAEGRRVDRLIEKITAAVADPTEADILAHYEAHRQEYLKPEQAQARHILIRPHSPGASDRAVARSRLEEIRRRIEEGADFADMAAAHSDCPSGKRSGGSLGWIARGAMVPAFDTALFGLQDGEVSDVVETSLGSHLIARTAGEPAAPADIAEVKDGIRDLLRHARRGEAIAAYIQELRKNAVIEDEAE
jgi:peptidyl-prolyl cis-trans isomerase C